MRLTLLHTNDIHGHLSQLPKIMTLVRRIRAQVLRAGGQVILLDAGDSSDFYSPVCEISHGVGNLRLLEAMGYAAATVGNWEGYAWGLSGLEHMAKVVRMPLLAANLFLANGEPVPGLKPYIWLTPGGIRVAVIGATIARARHYQNIGMRAVAADPIVRELAARLRREGADIVVFLSHLGYGDGRVPGDIQFAQVPSEVDVIIGGHSHTALHQAVWVESTQTLIAHAGHKGRFLGRIDFTIEEQAHRIVEFSSQLVRVTPDVPDDTPIQAVLEEAHEATTYRLAQIVGQASVPLPFFADRESPWGSLVADVMREVARADVGAVLGVHLDQGLTEGLIKRGQVRTAIPDKAHVWVVELTGAQLETMLARGLDPARMSQLGRTGGFAQLRREVGLFQVSNIRLRYRPGAAEANRITEIYVGDARLSRERIYQVATLWWTFSPPRGYVGDYVKLNPGQHARPRQPGRMLWELVEAYIRQRSPLQAPSSGRIMSVGKS